MVTPNNPAKYTGTDVYLANIVVRNRRPTTADVRQPETGKYYSLFCGWQVGKNPTTGNEGELWLLSKIVANQGIWIMIGSGVSPGNPVFTLSDTAGTLVMPTVLGNIQLTGTAGQINIVSDPGSNRLVFSLAGGGGAIDSIQVQAVTAPGVNPVVPNGSGLMTVNGAVVAAHSVPIESRSRAVNTYNLEVQVASLVSPTPANTNSVGLACYNTNQFQLDATSGMVSLKGSTTLPPVLTLTGDTGGAIGPTAAGNISTLGGGANTGVVTTGSANQIDFNVYRWVAPSANNWTPVLEGTTAAGVGTYVKQHGVYSRVGNMIFFTFDLEWSAHTGTGDMKITGFPKQFALANTNYPWPVFFENIVLPAGTVQVEFVGVNNQTFGQIYGCIDNATKSPVAMDGSGTLAVYGFYFSDQA